MENLGGGGKVWFPLAPPFALALHVNTLTLNKWKVSLTLEPSATVMFQVQLEKTSYSSGKFFVANIPDSPLRSCVHGSKGKKYCYNIKGLMRLIFKRTCLGTNFHNYCESVASSVIQATGTVEF